MWYYQHSLMLVSILVEFLQKQLKYLKGDLKKCFNRRSKQISLSLYKIVFDWLQISRSGNPYLPALLFFSLNTRTKTFSCFIIFLMLKMHDHNVWSLPALSSIFLWCAVKSNITRLVKYNTSSLDCVKSSVMHGYYITHKSV